MFVINMLKTNIDILHEKGAFHKTSTLLLPHKEEILGCTLIMYAIHFTIYELSFHLYSQKFPSN